MIDLNALKQANAKRWSNAKLTRKTQAASIALHLYEARNRYQAVQIKTGIPWPVIAVIHEREASQNWKSQLGQGDPLDEVSVHIPKGRGPFKTWEDGAYDALVNCPPYLARNNDWSLAGTLTELETYNGLGYAKRGVASPYLWSGTDQYRSGKYVRDGVYDPDKIDPQLGCAALLLAMISLDPSITFTSTKPDWVPTAAKAAVPSITNPSKGSIGAFVTTLLGAIFKRK